MRSITVIGSVNMDFVVVGDRLPREGETVLGRTFAASPGGKGANQAVAATLLGARVRLVGCVGEDQHGRWLRTHLRQCRVGVQGLRTVRGTTGVAVIMVDRRGRNLISVAPGANQRVRPHGTHDIAVLQLETPYMRPRARLVILNPAPARPVSLRGVDVVIPNEIEARQLTGHSDPARATRALVRMGAKRVLITLGGRGVYDGALRRRRPAFRVNVVDSVGAGDTFVGAFAAALARDHPDPVRFAQAAAALKCTRRGAQNGPTCADVERFLS